MKHVDDGTRTIDTTSNFGHDMRHETKLNRLHSKNITDMYVKTCSEVTSNAMSRKKKGLTWPSSIMEDEMNRYAMYVLLATNKTFFMRGILLSSIHPDQSSLGKYMLTTGI